MYTSRNKLGILNHAAVEALCSATYVENFLDCVHNLSDEVQRMITKIFELDFRTIEINKEMKVKEHMFNRVSDTSEDDSTEKKRRLLEAIQRDLIRNQEIADEKLRIVNEICENIENRRMQLDQDRENLDPLVIEKPDPPKTSSPTVPRIAAQASKAQAAVQLAHERMKNNSQDRQYKPNDRYSKEVRHKSNRPKSDKSSTQHPVHQPPISSPHSHHQQISPKTQSPNHASLAGKTSNIPNAGVKLEPKTPTQPSSACRGSTRSSPASLAITPPAHNAASSNRSTPSCQNPASNASSKLSPRRETNTAASAASVAAAALLINASSPHHHHNMSLTTAKLVHGSHIASSTSTSANTATKSPTPANNSKLSSHTSSPSTAASAATSSSSTTSITGATRGSTTAEVSTTRRLSTEQAANLSTPTHESHTSASGANTPSRSAAKSEQKLNADSCAVNSSTRDAKDEQEVVGEPATSTATEQITNNGDVNDNNAEVKDDNEEESNLISPVLEKGKRLRRQRHFTGDSDKHEIKKDELEEPRRKKKKKRRDIKIAKSPSPIKLPDILSEEAELDEITYCSCHQISYGDMIGCDYTGCSIEWYHFQCVGLESKPKGRWYCPMCRRGDKSNVCRSDLRVI